MIHICTYFDYNFLPRGLALYNSIKRFHKEFKYYVLAFDQKTFDYLIDLKEENIIPISFETYNNYFNTSPEKYKDRKQYYFSATPNICLYVFDNYQSVDLLLYLDADVFVFNSLETLYEEVENASIAICSHRFHPLFNFLSKNYGRYNVGVNFFRNSEVGRKCLLEWKADCDSWYPNKPGYPLNFFSDQIFLDGWVSKYSEITEIKNIGIDVAPWNMANYRFTVKDSLFYLNDKPLIIFHFSAFKKTGDNIWNGNTIFFFGSIKGVVLEIYKQYILEIESFGLDNSSISAITHKNSFLKRIFYFFMQFFMNETIRTDHR